MDTRKPGKRICVLGNSGSGKTHVAQALAEKLGLTYISNDAIILGADWQSTPSAKRLASFDAATRVDGWTFDGNLSDRPEDLLVLERCDTLVWLDLPRWAVSWQVIRRSVARVLTKEHLWHGNIETWRRLLSRDSIVWWSLKTYARRRRQYASLFADDTYADRARIRLRSRREVDAWLAGL